MPDRRIVFSGDPHWYFRIDDCLLTHEDAKAELILAGLSDQEANDYLLTLEVELE